MKKIFVGSSSEALNYAKDLCSILTSVPSVEPVLWPSVFEPGLVTVEALERVIADISGAALIASPDDTSNVRGSEVRVPRTNLMFELGIFSAILGRRNVALCKFLDVTLPTDLAGFTYIDMGDYATEGWHPPSQSWEILRRWASSLLDKPAKVPRTELVHGYSGRWRCIMTFERWRRRTMNHDQSAVVECFLDLHVDPDGRHGHGVAHGTLTVQLADPKSPGVYTYDARFALTDRITDIEIANDGTLTFTSETHARQCQYQSGDPGGQEGTMQQLSGPTVFRWEMRMSGANQLSGIYRTEADDRSLARIVAWRVHC